MDNVEQPSAKAQKLERHSDWPIKRPFQGIGGDLLEPWIALTRLDPCCNFTQCEHLQFI
jgi:hypothetical protein